MNPYHRYVSELARLVRDGRQFQLGGFPPLTRPAFGPKAPRALVFSPHPDDECITGLLPLRLMRESGLRVVNVAVTHGSNKARRSARWDELTAACGYLGFDLVSTIRGGLERIHVETRRKDQVHWKTAVEVVAGILEEHRPAVVFVPHEADWNSTHVGTHHLVMDALARQPKEFAATVVETEYWGAMSAPNAMAESSVENLAHLMTALSFHAGEVERNPYHLLLPAWMMDNVRRGSEIVGGQGGAAPDFTFATLYRVRRWAKGRLQAADTGRTLPATVPAAELLP